MANNIALAKTFIPILDDVYKQASLTSKLDGATELARQGANYNELIIPMLDMQGLGDYDRNSGYASGDVTMTHETVKCNFDRGRKFYVDALDEQETVGTAFSRLAGEFIRTKVVPELDAFRFACYAAKTGISKVAAGATLADGASVLTALRAATNKMDEDEVPMENRHLFITPTLDGMIADLDTTKSREILARFASKTLVPQTRFYTAIEQLDGKSTGEKAGGFRKYTTHYAKCASSDTGALKIVADSATPSSSEIKLSAVTPTVDPAYTPVAGDYVVAIAGADINFMIIHKPALIQYEKHVVPKIKGPEDDLDGDRHMFGYRNVGLADVYANKLAGIYLHHK